MSSDREWGQLVAAPLKTRWVWAYEGFLLRQVPHIVIVLRIYEVNIRQIRTQQQLLRISAEVMPNSVIVLRIYGINIRQIRLVITDF